MDVLERIKRGYRAVGPGAPRDVLAMFHQEQDDPPEWVIDESGRISSTHDVVAMDLFAVHLPSQWEIVGVELRNWDLSEKASRLVVGGSFRARLRGTWEVMPLPFVHVWSFCGDQVQNVFDYFGGVEVKRRVDVCPPRRRRFWRHAGALG